MVRTDVYFNVRLNVVGEWTSDDGGDNRAKRWKLLWDAHFRNCSPILLLGRVYMHALIKRISPLNMLVCVWCVCIYTIVYCARRRLQNNKFATMEKFTLQMSFCTPLYISFGTIIIATFTHPYLHTQMPFPILSTICSFSHFHVSLIQFRIAALYYMTVCMCSKLGKLR